MITAVIVAGGSGSRMGKKQNKVFLALAGKTVIEHTLDAFEAASNIDEIVVVARKEDMTFCKELLKDRRVKIVAGGKTRMESVGNGLKSAEGEIVAIHDAARALIDAETIDKTIDDCKKYGAAAVGVPCVDTLKKADSDGFIEKTVDRADIYRIQTPQVFFTEKICAAHTAALADGFDATDDCAVYEKYAGKVKISEGKASNIKITFPEDLAFAEAIIAQRKI